MTILTWVALLGGLALLVLGADWLVRGASQLAAKIGISPLVIGLTVVAFGTSAPEMAVSVQSTLAGQADIALGNVVGSNIFNILFILGVSAIITPLIVQQQLVRLDVPIMIGISILTYFLSLDGVINRFEGIILFAGIIAYTIFLIIQSRKENKAVEQEYAQEYSAKADNGWKSWVINIGLVGLGLTLLVVGSDFLVNSSIEIARWLGVSELVIGLTIVAAGTSMPEVATSVTAALKGERDIAVGNVVGSNIFNILAVLGLGGSVAPAGLVVSSAALNFDIPVMIAIAVACFPVFFTGGQIYRWEGALFLAYYVIYTAYLIMNATNHSSLPMFSSVMIWFVLPITALTFVISLWYEFSVRRRQKA
ncbi:MAG TPA: calcium/sodium antiporter [Anaerolineales bacterium]|jgi:cation:H+ antiporter|nr:sodium:calcium antiporter [Anaerolineae bacterium]HRJ56820.1 calcium/sodium antiporter [Anaerolineales bacterium]HRK91057.1 calcium/sodium antiporter [Anaerolineales bacterium]